MIIEKIGEGIFKVPSFSDDEEKYRVQPYEGICTCKRYEIHANCHKHIEAARAFEWAMQFSGFNEDNQMSLWDFIKAIFAPIKKDTSVDSYKLFQEVAFFPYASPELVEEALKRHVRVLFKTN